MRLSYFKQLLVAPFMAAALAGCTQEFAVGDASGADNGREMTITVTVPGQQTPATRSIADAAGEAAVQTIDILVFDQNAVLTQHAVGTSITPVAGGENYSVTFKASLTADAGARTVAVVANTPGVATLIEDATNKVEVLAALTHSKTGLWKATGPSDYDPIPMYGEAVVAGGITAGMTIENVPLTRMLARVDLVVNEEAGFTISSVYLVNRKAKGYVAPAWDNSTGALSGSLPASPMIPSGSAVLTGLDGALDYSYSGAGLTGEIYTYEAPATSGDEGDESHTNAICLIVKGRRTGDTQDYYYRIDFTTGTDASGNAPSADGFNPATVAYMPVFRNHLYRFVIGSADGRGHATFDGALGSLGVSNNLKTNLLVVDLAGINDIVFDGQHYLGVNKRDFAAGWDGLPEPELRIATNAAGGWTAASGDEWLTFVDGGQTESGSIGAHTLELRAAPITELHTTEVGHESRTGIVTLTAGRLETYVTLTQYLPVLRHVSNTLPVQPDPIPQTGGEYTVTAYTNLQGWGVKVYLGSDNSGTELVTTPFDNAPVIYPAALAAPSSTAVPIPENSGASDRTLAIYLYCQEFAGLVNEVWIGTFSQSAPTFDGGGNHVLYFSDDGKLMVGRWADEISDVTKLAFFKFGSVIGFVLKDEYNATDVKFDPTGTGYASFDAIPYYTTDDYNNSNIPHNISDNAYHNLENVMRGKGDPCRLAGMRPDELNGLYDQAALDALEESLAFTDGGWRLPTIAEQAWYIRGPFTERWQVLDYPSAGEVYYYQKTSPFDKPWQANFYETVSKPSKTNPNLCWLPAAQTATTQTTNKRPLPCAGFTNKWIAGSPNYGYYWSSTPKTETTAYELNFGPDRLDTSSAYMRMGQAVRCIRR